MPAPRHSSTTRSNAARSAGDPRRSKRLRVAAFILECEPVQFFDNVLPLLTPNELTVINALRRGVHPSRYLPIDNNDRSGCRTITPDHEFELFKTLAAAVPATIVSLWALIHQRRQTSRVKCLHLKARQAHETVAGPA